MHTECPACDFKYEGVGGNEGFYLRSTSLNFGVTLIGYLVPVLALAYNRKISMLAAEVSAIAGAFVVPVLLYRPSRSWGLMNYYFFFPGELPANGGGLTAKDTKSSRG